MAAPRRPWGWHELEDRWARALVADCGIRPGDLVLGAGRGALTAPLVEIGARVIAIETHPERLGVLRARFGRDARVVRADGSDLRLPRRPFHVVANPSFAITSALVTRLVQRGSRLESAHLVLQASAARRWSRPDAPGARRWRAEFTVALGRPVPRRAFRPAPAVDARVLVIRRRFSASARG